MKNSLEIEVKEISYLRPDPNNARKHDAKNIDAIAKSLERFGQRKPIVIRGDGTIVAGNGTVEAAKLLGWTEIACARVPWKWTADEVKAYALADNRTAELAEWDSSFLAEQLLELDAEGWDVSELGFEALEPPINPDGEDESPLEFSKEPVTKLGDIWQLGRHRLMCGDSTDQTTVSRLMNNQKAVMVFTDPPYNTGMSAQSNKNSTRLNHFFDDNYSQLEWSEFLPKIINTLDFNTNNNAVIYISFSWKRNHELVPEIIKKFQLTNIIIWDKIVHGLGSDYQYTYEVINVCKKGKPIIDSHQGEQEYQDVWHIQRKVGKNDDHATAKPVELCARAIRHGSKQNEVVLDIFGGSGTTLIAAEQLNRICYIIELDPKYCDVIITRWQNLTGQSAELICE